jgi:GNAT superfamily N-acetyltransferase
MDSTAAGGIQCRPEREEDEPFLLQLYASTRDSELQLTDWTAEEKQTFVAAQFNAQRKHYRQVFPEARFDVIERLGVPVGRLYVDRHAEEIRLIDIALIPEARSCGLGTALLSALLDEAAATRQKVTIHVERFNPALRLYERLGFKPIEDKGVYVLMEARPLAG